ncbi:MAG: extracellular solute-binding protein [Lachnospiraceae bacterium]|nr:extracellular solute-binding protein [Lachnospiraceae bacterium]
MKKFRKGQLKRIFAAGMSLVIVVSLLGGCGNSGQQTAGNGSGNRTDDIMADGGSQADEQLSGSTAMGRYLEEAADLSESLSGYRNAIFKLEDGGVVLTDPMKNMRVSKDHGVTWESDGNTWLSEILDRGGFIDDYAVGADGTVGILYTYMESEDETDADESAGPDLEEEEKPWWASEKRELLIVKPDGTEMPVVFTVMDEDMCPSHIWISEQGRVFVGTQGSDLYEILEDGSSKVFLTLEDSPQIIQFQGSRMIIDGYGYDSLLIYDMESSEFIEDDTLDTFVNENYGDRAFNGGSWYDLYFFPGEDNILYLAGEKGVHRHVIGGSAMEQIVDANLTTFGNPTYRLLGMIALENNEFMAIFTDARLVRFIYDSTVPTVPGQTIKAYSLKENNTLRRAISIYQIENPDVYVEYEIGMEDNNGVTRDDALKKLNTEIMAGNGPDLLILDDMPVDSYIEKGMLADIAPLIDSMNGEGKLFERAVDTYRQEGKIYVVPCEISLPIMEGAPNYVSDINDLEGIADAVERLRKDHPGMDLLQICSPKGVMKQFAMVCAPAWLTESGELNREMISDFLTQTKRIYDAQMEGLSDEVIRQYEEENEEHIQYYEEMLEESDWFGRGTEEVYYVTGEKQIMTGVLGGAYTYAEITSVQRTTGFEDNVILPMFGQCKNVFWVDTLAGISAVSTQIDRAEGLLKVLLGDEDISGMGFPINRTAFESSLFPADFVSTDTAYSQLGFEYEDGSSFYWNIYWYGEQQADILKGWMQAADTPYVRNKVLEEAVYNAGTSYIQGETSLEEAVSAVEKSMAIYMAE